MFVTSVGPWANKTENLILEPEPDALFSVNAAAGEPVTLPVLDIATGTKGKVDWGDGEKETFSNEETRSSVTDNKITFSHTYASAFTGQTKIYVEEGNISGEVSAADFVKFSVNNSEKVAIHKPFVFKVDNYGKKVKFSPGNLYWNGSEFKCEEHQYDYPIDWNESHVGHFKWGSTVADAISSSISDPSGSPFFAVDGGAVEGYTVLSKEEWKYLFNKALAKNSSGKNTITIAGKSCIVLKPDGFSGSVADSYTAETWVAAEASGLVALPFAGLRVGLDFSRAGSSGLYWSSTSADADHAWGADFMSNDANTYNDNSNGGFSVRLVKVVQ